MKMSIEYDMEKAKIVGYVVISVAFVLGIIFGWVVFH